MGFASCTHTVQQLIPASLFPAVRTALLFILGYPFLVFCFGEDGKPGGSYFALLVIYEVSFLLGRAFQCCGLPSLIGGLLAGFALRNVPWIGEQIGAQVAPLASQILRSFALTLILCRAGLEMDFPVLRRLCGAVARLAILPCLFESSAVALFAVIVLGFPILWAFMLGFVVAAVSPAVVVPSILALQVQGYGKSTGIPTVVSAAAALDDVFSIGGFSIFFGLAFAGVAGSDSGGGSNSTSTNVTVSPRLLSAPSGEPMPLWWQLLKIPVELIVGVGLGCLMAWLLIVLLPTDNLSEDESEETVEASPKTKASAREYSAIDVAWRVILLTILASCLMFGLQWVEMSGAAALAVLVVAAGASLGWGEKAKEPVAECVGVIWNNLAAPILFGLVGASVFFAELNPADIGWGMLLLCFSLLVRCLAVSVLAMSCMSLRWQEKLFAALAWLPKATVQAALGPIALNEALSRQQAGASVDNEIRMGQTILTVAVLSVMVTAPFGALLINCLGPVLLTREEPGMESLPTEETSPTLENEEEEEDDDEEDDEESTDSFSQQKKCTLL